MLREQAPGDRPGGGRAPAAGQKLPASLAAVLTDRLRSVSAGTAQMLRTAALLGGRFAVTDLAVVLRRPASELSAGVEEAVAAGILTGSDPDLAFRHLLIQQALYESMPAALRTALHAEAARELAASGADVLSVAQQLSAANKPGQAWVRKWLVEAGPALAVRAPQIGAEISGVSWMRRPAGRNPGWAHGQPGLGVAGRRVLSGSGPAGQPGADGDGGPGAAG